MWMTSCPTCGWDSPPSSKANAEAAWADHSCRHPTVAEMAGTFEGGPDSVEWLREQRDGR